MRTWMGTMLLALLGLGLATGGRAAADEKSGDLDEAQVKALVAEAASVRAEVLRLVTQLGPKVGVADLAGENADAPLTLVAVVVGGRGLLDEGDFRVLGGPQAFAAALSPEEVRAGRRVPRHPYASIAHPEYVQEVTIDANGPTATGRVVFRAPDAFAGVLHYVAHRGAGGWRVLELTFPRSGLRTTLQGGRWKLHVPKRIAGVNPLRGGALDLPRVGTVGPAPAGKQRVVVSVTRDGWIRVPDRRDPLSLVALERWLAEQTADPALREPDGSSRMDVLIDVDASMPWVITQWVMQTCAHPRVKAYKLWFGAATLDGKATGALGASLPKDRGLAPTQPRDFMKHKIKVFKRTEERPSDLRALYARIRTRQAAAPGDTPVVFEIVAPPPKGGAVPHGYVLGILDVCLAAGARDVVFEGAAMPLGGPDRLDSDAGALRAYLLALRDRPGTPRIRYGNDKDLLPTAGAFPAVPALGLVKERRAATAGMAAEFVEEELEEVPEVFEQPDDKGKIGIGGGAGGAFRGRGGRPGVPPSARRTRADAMEDGLKWLAAHQAPNGGWSARDFGAWCDGKPRAGGAPQPDGRGKALYDVGVTGLALTAFLGAGYTNRGNHPHAKVVSRGLRYLKNVQDPEGCFGPRATQQYIYNHATAALAMVEAYGMTGSPIFKGSAQRALDFVALARNPYFAWRYGVKPGDNDTSVTAWMGLVLKSARLINEDATKRGKRPPLMIDETAFDGIRAWLEKVTDPDYGRVGYVQRGTGVARPRELVDRFPPDRSRSMTAAGVFLRVLIGQDPRKHALIGKGMKQVASRPPTWNPSDGSIDMYYWHWGTLAMHQAGTRAQRAAWRERIHRAVVARQRLDGDFCGLRGSWDPLGPWGPDGGRVYSTALMTICLQAEYGYARWFPDTPPK